MFASISDDYEADQSVEIMSCLVVPMREITWALVGNFEDKVLGLSQDLAMTMSKVVLNGVAASERSFRILHICLHCIF